MARVEYADEFKEDIKNNKSKMNTQEFLLKHSQEWSKKYPGRYIAVIGDKLVAINKSAIEAFNEAKKKFPDKEVCIEYIPTKKETITLL